MTSGQDVSEFLDILGLVKSYFSSFFWRKKNKKKSRIFFLWQGIEDYEEDDEGGVYLKPCEKCKGSRKVHMLAADAV